MANVGIQDATVIRLDGNRQACPCCKRKFSDEVVKRHVPLCKDHVKKRKALVPFDSSKQRSSVLLVKPQSQKAGPPKLNSIKWREAHSVWIATKNGLKVRKAKGHTAAFEAAPSKDGLILCPGCDTKFKKETADSHIPFCFEKNKRK